MQVAVAPSPGFRCDNSACSSPLYISAPSSPKRFAAAVYDAFTDHFNTSAPNSSENDDYDFVFEFSGPLQNSGQPTPALYSADELFDEGKIRPFKPYKYSSSSSSPLMANSRSRGACTSLSPSPLRPKFTTTNESTRKNTCGTTKMASILRSRVKSWRLKDMLLFRSASEGRATNRGSKDPLRKYTRLQSSEEFLEDSRTCRKFRTAAELHYTAKKEAAEEMKKKTALPYRQSLFGCLRFNPAIVSLSRGINRCSVD